jgi:hypothetical protein
MSEKHIREGLACLGVVFVFLIGGFTFGTLAGIATPGGWPAWHVGALVGTILGGLAFVICFATWLASMIE